MNTHDSVLLSQTNHLQHSLPNCNLQPNISKAEASHLVSEMGYASSKVFNNVVLLISKQGHIALGYSHPVDCLRKRLPELSASFITRLFTAATIYLKLDPERVYLNKVSEATLRPLQDISDLDAIAVWNHVLDHYEHQLKRINSRHITKAMTALHINVAHSKPAVVVNIGEELQPHVQHYVQKISQAIILPNVHNRAEFRQFAKLIYQLLLDQCQLDDCSAVA